MPSIKTIATIIIGTCLFLVLACSPKNSTNLPIAKQQTALQEKDILNELIIQFREEIEIDNWLIAYKQYGVSLKKTVSKTANIFLFTYQSNTSTETEILKLFEKDEVVKVVELNKKIRSR